VVIEGIKSIPGAYCPTPKGAFYVMAKLPIDDSDKFCQWLLEKFNENKRLIDYFIKKNSRILITEIARVSDHLHFLQQLKVLNGLMRNNILFLQMFIVLYRFLEWRI